jgi:squalene-associated FAD-dependent desaturase
VGTHLKLAVIGGGWAGLAAAVSATQAGHSVTVFEAGSTLGGRARAIRVTLPDGREGLIDNGQHILIGAYSATQRLMRTVGVEPTQVLLDLPMTLQFPDGLGLRFPDWPTPLDALGAILGARGWDWADKVAMLRHAIAWRHHGFSCAPELTVAELCRGLTPRVRTELIEPLCVSALNTPDTQASAGVFLRVLQDALFGEPKGSHLLIPKTDLGQLFPDAAEGWLQRQGGQVWRRTRVNGWQRDGRAWRVDLGGGDTAPAVQRFDALVLATSASNAAQALIKYAKHDTTKVASQCLQWAALAQAMPFEAIATVYAYAPQARLPLPMLALRSNAARPAQFVFDRARLGGPSGLLAFVVSAARGERAQLQQRVLDQARTQLGLTLQAVQTVVERRATFACTPGLQRPAQHIAAGLLACGDYVAGPYPATLEGAIRSGEAIGAALTMA